MTPRWPAWRSGAALLALLLAACAQVPRTPSADVPPGDVRSGRLALSVADQPTQSFSAGFELRGQPQAGQLTLLNPLGGTVAVLRWQPGTAVLETPGKPPQQFPSIDAMVEQAAGAAMPVAALFDWLAGVNTPVPGWEADLSQLGEGRLRAQRREPPPQADLRVVLDR
jgi:outer membrane lipoprotein LolB